MRRSPDGGKTFPRSSSKGYRYEVDIKPGLPNRPTTVPTADHRTVSGRLLVLDLDASRVPAGGVADRAGYVAAVAQRIVALVAECGGRALVDVSPSGGRHVYVLWSRSIPFLELRAVTRALALRFEPVVDTSPMESTDGQIRGPGSPHRSQGGRLTGYMVLTCTVAEAEAICARGCGPEVWDALQVELAAELDELAGGRPMEAGHPDAPPATLDTHGEQYWPRRGGRGPLRADLEETARTGRYDRSRYQSSSEARQAVLSSAAARGWRLEQVRAQLHGEWAAIRHWWRDEKLLAAEWTKAITYTTGLPTPAHQKMGDPVCPSNTSEPYITPPAAPPGPEQAGTAASTNPDQDLYPVKRQNPWGIGIRPKPWQLNQYQQIRMWQQAMRIVERLLELDWGERALTYRAVLRAVGAAAQMTGATTVEFGTRQLAYMTGLDHTTVARALQVLSSGSYALIDQVLDAVGTRADVYQLMVPDLIAAEASWRSWRPGRIEAIHPAFRVLGLPAAFVYEALSAADMTARELSTLALLPRSSTYQALQELAAHGLAEHGPDGGWRRGPANLEDVAVATGATDLADEHLAEHRADRADWHRWLGLIGQLTDLDERGPDAPDGDSQHDSPPPSTAGVAVPAPRDCGEALTAGAVRRLDQQRRHGSAGRRNRAAPPWLVPPPRHRPIRESDLGWPAEALAVTDELRQEAAQANWALATCDLSSDIRAAIHADLDVITADSDRSLAEQAAYEAILAALHTSSPPAASRTGPRTGLTATSRQRKP